MIRDSENTRAKLRRLRSKQLEEGDLIQVSICDEPPSLHCWQEESRVVTGKFVRFTNAGWYVVNTLFGEERIDNSHILGITRVTRREEGHGEESV